MVTGKFAFPHYRSHRLGSLTLDGIGWLLKFGRKKRREREAHVTLRSMQNRRYFLFPLQLSGDFQIRAHSPFHSMRAAVDYVLESFAGFAPAEDTLLIKEHPLDSGFVNWRSYLTRRARGLGILDRVFHIDGGDLQILAQKAAGMVCVNSTSGTLALEVGLPVVVLGDAVYDVRGMTHQAGLDQFWAEPETPDRALYDAFKRMLHARCLVRGGLASASGVATLVKNSVERLLAEPGPIRPRADRPRKRMLQGEGINPASGK